VLNIKFERRIIEKSIVELFFVGSMHQKVH